MARSPAQWPSSRSYVAVGFVSLAIDRRALMVSALTYVLIAVGALFREFDAVGINIALTVIIIGAALLLLSAFWQGARARAVDLLPTHPGGLLPPPGLRLICNQLHKPPFNWCEHGRKFVTAL